MHRHGYFKLFDSKDQSNVSSLLPGSSSRTQKKVMADYGAYGLYKDQNCCTPPQLQLYPVDAPDFLDHHYF